MNDIFDMICIYMQKITGIILFRIKFITLMALLMAIDIQMLLLIQGLVMLQDDAHRFRGVLLFKPPRLIRAVLKGS